MSEFALFEPCSWKYVSWTSVFVYVRVYRFHFCRILCTSDQLYVSCHGYCISCNIVVRKLSAAILFGLWHVTAPGLFLLTPGYIGVFLRILSGTASFARNALRSSISVPIASSIVVQSASVHTLLSTSRSTQWSTIRAIGLDALWTCSLQMVSWL